jgi:hypothetical protein
MKKNRNGILMTILCSPERIAELSGFLFEETTTIGLRWRMDNRIKAQRKNTVVTTRFGEVHCKLAQLNTKVINVKPEYDDCKRLALEHNVPLKTVMEEARAKANEMRIQGNFSEDDHL